MIGSNLKISVPALEELEESKKRYEERIEFLSAEREAYQYQIDELREKILRRRLDRLGLRLHIWLEVIRIRFLAAWYRLTGQ